MYADDTAICVHASVPHEMQQKLESVMVKVSRWYQVNKLSVNLNKTKLMFFGTGPMLECMNQVQVRLDHIDIARVDAFKYLGLMLDSKLTFKEHIK